MLSGAWRLLPTLKPVGETSGPNPTAEPQKQSTTRGVQHTKNEGQQEVASVQNQERASGYQVVAAIGTPVPLNINGATQYMLQLGPSTLDPVALEVQLRRKSHHQIIHNRLPLRKTQGGTSTNKHNNRI
jgi:hypothetical protein